VFLHHNIQADSLQVQLKCNPRKIPTLSFPYPSLHVSVGRWKPSEGSRHADTKYAQSFGAMASQADSAYETPFWTFSAIDENQRPI
jgi:hypothetical protein